MYVCNNVRVYICIRLFCSQHYSLGYRYMQMYVPDKYQALGTTKLSPYLTKNAQGRQFQQQLDSLLIKIIGDRKSSNKHIYIYIYISGVSKPMSQMFPGYSPPPLKQPFPINMGPKVNRFILCSRSSPPRCVI
jgi:hypothetical protein